MYWDFFTVTVVALAISILSPDIPVVGSRNIIFLGVMFAAITGAFMVAFEKYLPGAEDLWEKNVISILSALLTWVLLIGVNLVFFFSKALAVLLSIMALVCMVALIVVNVLLVSYYNSKKFRKARLLIIATEDRNFVRMKRIKYGVTGVYDTWYEQVKGDISTFADEMFPKFDAVCILDGISDADYNIAVKKAMLMNKEIFVVPKIIDIGKCKAQLVRLDDILTMYIPEHSLNRVERALKRLIDIAMSGAGLIVAAIPMLLIAVAIKLTSPGPVFYKQVRCTRGKKEFEIYKFRTMVPDAEKLSGPTFAQKDDPRITKVGKLLRACRLDELPQLINIFRGDMSVVGPRPERPFFVEQFEDEIENYDYRFRVKAGLTALSHVYGRYSTDIHDRTCYDLYYIANYSLLLDIKIILLTAKTMFQKSAAEGVEEYNTPKEVVANEKE